MKTKNDRTFCILVASIEGIHKKKMPYLMYMLQHCGYELNYSYSIKCRTLKSHGLLSSIGDQVSEGYISQDCSLTSKGEEEITKYFITDEENTKLNMVLVYVRNLDIEDLFYICVTDILITELIKKGGSNALINEKSSILSTLSSLCPNFGEDDFNDAVCIINKIKEQ